LQESDEFKVTGGYALKEGQPHRGRTLPIWANVCDFSEVIILAILAQYSGPQINNTVWRIERPLVSVLLTDGRGMSAIRARQIDNGSNGLAGSHHVGQF
jgi:hypothetical protein